MPRDAVDLTVWYVEDDPAVRRGGEQAMSLAGLQVRAFGSAEPALASIDADFAGVLLTDVRLPGMDGMALMRAVLERDREIPVLLVTGHGDITMAVEAMRAGAYDFIEKPHAAEQLVETVRRALDRRALVLENRRLRRELARHAPAVSEILGGSAAIARVRELVASLGPTRAEVLLYGETGAGKEVVARALHAASGRTGEFVAINCAAIPESVFEAEMFGYEPGAFTGATRRRIGKLEHARGGTVFLDEIESMPAALQVKLLRVLQERVVERLGGNQCIATDCRIVAASKCDLFALATDGAARFRLDLYYRLSVATIDIPALRERREDIPLLLERFVHEAAARYDKPVPVLAASRLGPWLAYDWPGNVRELRNAADRLVLGLPAAFDDETRMTGANADHHSLTARMDAYERAVLAGELERARGNVATVAAVLDMPRKTLYDRLRRHGLVAGRFRLVDE